MPFILRGTKSSLNMPTYMEVPLPHINMYSKTPLHIPVTVSLPYGVFGSTNERFKVHSCLTLLIIYPTHGCYSAFVAKACISITTNCLCYISGSGCGIAQSMISTTSSGAILWSPSQQRYGAWRMECTACSEWGELSTNRQEWQVTDSSSFFALMRERQEMKEWGREGERKTQRERERERERRGREGKKTLHQYHDVKCNIKPCKAKL